MVSRAWIWVLVDRRRLDYELAEGCHPHSRPELELRAPAPAAARGVALAELLLVHPSSPVHSTRSARTIEDWVAEAHAALR